MKSTKLKYFKESTYYSNNRKKDSYRDESLKKFAEDKRAHISSDNNLLDSQITKDDEYKKKLLNRVITINSFFLLKSN